ncbi:MAG: glycosyltransferase 87 family protein [Terracidiphilus sp.]
MSSANASATKPRIDFVELSIATVAGLALAFTTLFLCVVPLAGKIAASRDFVCFWATGQQLVHHGNPYDAATMKQIEQSAGLAKGYGVLFMRNPPWTLPLVVALGFVGLRIGAFLWSMAIFACLLASVLILWRMHGRPRNHLHWIALSFGPALLCSIMGQTTMFALFGYVLFLCLHRTHPFLAGMSLWLCALKPHLFIPFGVVLIVWIIVSRSYRIFMGAAIALAASCAIAYLLDPTAWHDYAQMMRAAGLESEYIPCLVVVLRLWLNPHAIWLQYLAPLLGSAWALSYFWSRRKAWDWEESGNLLVLVSLVAAPYSWVYDGGLAIPALMQGLYRTRSRLLLVILSFASLAILVELVSGFMVTSPQYLWTVPAWFIWYLLACATTSGPQSIQLAEQAV